MSEFSGTTYEPTVDRGRLASQQTLIRDFMLNYQWWTLFELQEALAKQNVSAALTGVSARVRCLRKPEWGNYDVEGRRRSAGVWEYRLKGVRP